MGKNDTLNWDELEAEAAAAGHPPRKPGRATAPDVEPVPSPSPAAREVTAAPVEAESYMLNDIDELTTEPPDEAMPVVRPAQFVNLNDEPGYGERNGIDLLRDVEVELTVELGSTRMLIKHILGLRPGSVVELNRLAGEPVDIVINKTLIARGEVVVVDEKFAIRVVEIVPPERRLATA
jgi:flagellar motor switch protein FliN